MRKVALYSILLVAGLLFSQVLPVMLGDSAGMVALVVRTLTMTGLAFIMIHVGFEFHIDKRNLKRYGWDYLVAFSAAALPWVFVTLYFVFVMLPSDYWRNDQTWRETLLAGRFAAPTSAGVLFTMLAAAGLASTWVFRKARILAIFDDLDTVLLMIPLKMLMVGLAWQLGAVVGLMVLLLVAGYVLMHRVRIPVTWPWVLGYAVAIAGTSEVVYAGSKWVDADVPIHIEVLLPAFVLGMIAYPRGNVAYTDAGVLAPQESAIEVEHALEAMLDRPAERRASMVISGLFMVLVGLSMPPFVGAAAAAFADASTVTGSQAPMGWGAIGLHVIAVTVVSNIGKMFPAFCYRREAHWRDRLAVAIGMWPRGEVGAGVLVVSLSYGIGGPIVTVAMLSLALNLVLTGAIILVVRRLVTHLDRREPTFAVAPEAQTGGVS